MLASQANIWATTPRSRLEKATEFSKTADANAKDDWESMFRISQYGDYGGSHYDYGILSMIMGGNMSMILGDPIFFYKIRPFSLFETNSFGVQYPNVQRLPYPELQITYLYNLVYICIYPSLGSKRWFPHRRGASTAFSRVHPILKRLETARTCVSLAAASLVQRLKIPLPRRG